MNDDDSDSSRAYPTWPRAASVLVACLTTLWAIILLRTPTRDYLISALHPWPYLFNLPADERGEFGAWTKHVLAEERRRYAASLVLHPGDPDVSVVYSFTPYGDDNLLAAKREMAKKPSDFRLLGFYLTVALNTLHNTRCEGPLTNGAWPAKNPYPMRRFSSKEAALLIDVVTQARRGVVLVQSAAILCGAIPVYLGLWMTTLGLGILAVVPSVSAAEHKIIAGMKSQGTHALTYPRQ